MAAFGKQCFIYNTTGYLQLINCRKFVWVLSDIRSTLSRRNSYFSIASVHGKVLAADASIHNFKQVQTCQLLFMYIFYNLTCVLAAYAPPPLLIKTNQFRIVCLSIQFMSLHNWELFLCNSNLCLNYALYYSEKCQRYLNRYTAYLRCIFVQFGIVFKLYYLL